MEQRRERRAARSVTIHDVAVQAGVSHMTVSRVLNGEGYVKAETRDRVREAIRSLNYRPNSAARSLAGVDAPMVGLLYDNPSTSYLSEFFIGALSQCRTAGAQMVVSQIDERETLKAVIEDLLAAGVEALVLPPPLCESLEAVEEIRQSGAAAVAVAPGLANALLPTVRIDNLAAARDLANHLLALGHTRFGFIKGAPNQTVSRQRMAGFLEALVMAGLDPTEVLFEAGDFTYRSGLDAAERLLSHPQRPTALIVANDDMAAAALMSAHRMGLNVPGELSIVGFDDTYIASTVWPALTTIRQPIADMARDAVDLAIQQIAGKKKGPGGPPQVQHPHQLIVRESSGPAPG
jgi:LacI family transcriptional regulator